MAGRQRMHRVQARLYTRTSFLPDYLQQAHQFCIFEHDVLVELLRSAEQHDVFQAHIVVEDDEDHPALDDGRDLFDWFASTGRDQDRNVAIRLAAFPALLSDLLHFVCAALDASRQRKLTVAYALIRKPLQENLCLLEWIANDMSHFGNTLAANPLLLRAQKAGGVPVHADRIRRALELIGEAERFDAQYLAQIRYDRSAEDSLDASCQKALHLFTEHRALATERLNINFIFSSEESHLSQWNYLYSRLPYLLCYVRKVVEYIVGTLGATDPEYLKDIERREMAGMLLWHRSIHADYRCVSISRLIRATRKRLNIHCRNAGFRIARLQDLPRMYACGAYPGESRVRVHSRSVRYKTLRVISAAASAAHRAREAALDILAAGSREAATPNAPEGGQREETESGS